jgi:putative hydrolase
MIEIASRPNREAARLLRRTAGLLAEQEEDGFRIRAYRRAADVMDALDRPVGTILEREGIDGLIALPGIGEGIAFGLAEWYRTGKLPALQRLRGKSDPVSLLATVPSLGRKLADRIHHELGIGSLEDLELAAWDGRLDSLPGFGPRRLETIRSALSARLGRRPIVLTSTEDRPPVADLIAVDREYRRKAKALQLRTITPRRFNPDRRAWLPVLHTIRGGRHYTALFSNTLTAHRLKRTDDWVVLYYDGKRAEGQATVVTERSGRLRGRRVVRGREAECYTHYGVWLEPEPHAQTDGDGVF